jgi:hypothetical protein
MGEVLLEIEKQSTSSRWYHIASRRAFGSTSTTGVLREHLFIASSDAFGFQSIIYNPDRGNLQIAVFNNGETDPVGFESSVKEIE